MNPTPALLYFVAALALVLGLAPLGSAADPTPTPAKLRGVPVLDGLEGPIDFAVEADGTIWWNEYYSGNVNRYDPKTQVREVMFHADPIPDGVERGLVGLALDPNVAENGIFYVYYTVADPADPEGGTNRLSRIEDGKETIFLTATAAKLHNGGRIVLAPDGTLFVSVGENNKGAPAQDPQSLLGKILHLTSDGQPAPGNIAGFVYDLGHRNVYGLAYDAVNNRLFATENSNAERDEVNLIEAGKNYGWPFCEGFSKYDPAQYKATGEPCDDPKFTPPIGEFYANRTVAPTGAGVLKGRLYWGSWNQGAIHRVTLDPATNKWTDGVIYQPGGRINDLEAGPDGHSLYYSNWTTISRVDLPDVVNEIEIPVEPVDGLEETPATTSPGTPGVGFMSMVALVALAAFSRRPR